MNVCMLCCVGVLVLVIGLLVVVLVYWYVVGVLDGRFEYGYEIVGG